MLKTISNLDIIFVINPKGTVAQCSAGYILCIKNAYIIMLYMWIA